MFETHLWKGDILSKDAGNYDKVFSTYTAKTMKFSVKDFFNKCEQIVKNYGFV